MQTQPPARPQVVASADAIGGVDRLRALTAVRVSESGHEYLISVGDPRQAPTMIVESITSLRRESPAGLRQTMSGNGAARTGGFSFTLVASDSAVNTASLFDRQTSDEALALSPERVLLTALDAQDLHARPDSTIDGIRHHIVEFHWADGVVRLAIDASNNFPSYMALTRAYPTARFWQMWGDLRLVTHWSEWSFEPSGVWYPRVRSESLNGQPLRDFLVTSLDLAATAPADSFAIADSLRTIRPIPDPTLHPVTIADGIVLFQGYYQSALVREPKGIIVLEASESDAKARAVIAQAATLFPGVPIVGVISTSSAWSQFGGLREYAARGVPIYTLDVNASRVRDLLAAPFHSHPDSLARTPRAATLRIVHDSLTVGRMKLIAAPGPRGSGTMLVYFPDNKLLYASDLILPQVFEPNFYTAGAEELKRSIARLGIPVEKVFAFHVSPQAE
jgi:hypothetical protein